jgi:tetratricopeptide (TPR) repeat protein
MSADKKKSGDDKTKPAAASAPVKAAAQPKPIVPPLFRKIDWLTMAITFAVIWVVYVLTMAPEVTLEDSGELCTGSFYAGIPHPPGYPVWTIYTWLWTVLVPFNNVAWRVALGEATAGAMACGLVALMVSRGGSMLMEGIEELKNMTGKWEGAICLVCGSAAGLLFGLDGFVWKESIVVNRVCIFSVPWFLTMMLFILRWIYAPNQYRYLYWGVFMYGLCLTTHQSLIVASLGLEIVIAISNPRLGRDIFFCNFMIYLIDILFLWKTGQHFFQNIGARSGLLLLFNAIGLGSLLACGLMAFFTKGLLNEWKPILIMIPLFVLGVSIYFYMPLAGMTNPPMQWGYPRTVEGFIHALTRGQYDQPNPTNVLADPSRFFMQMKMLVEGVANEFTWVYVFIALVPFAFFFKMKKRERVWIIALAATYLSNGVFLMILMNPTPDRASADLIKVFFASSHAVVATLVGYGLVLIAAFMATHYARFRRWGLAGGAIAIVLAAYCLLDVTGKHFLGPTGEIGLSELPHWIGQAFVKNHYALPIFASLILLAIPVVFLTAMLAYRKSAPLAITLGLFAIMPLHSGLSHWFKSEQRNHWFGYWYGHDMFCPPFTGPDGKLSYDPQLREQAMKGPNGNLVYPEMTRDAILFGGTDPGRFCPTYMVFCESFIPHNKQPVQDQHFDRRDVYVITQNALADGTYLEYIRAHYNRSRQIDPPFFQNLFRGKAETEQNFSTNFIARLAYQILDRPFTRLGAKIEARRRKEGVYPAAEIAIPSDEDNGQCGAEYRADASRRLDHDMRFPNEPKQIRPDEGVHVVGNQVSFGGQGYVMGINGLLTKVIFDRNPKNEFFVEESFPLDWMYPHLSPYGVIMKVNREPVNELTDEMVRRDHEFWSHYSDRLIGNWITYDTPLKQITDFIEKVYVRHDFDGFQGDRKFLRDDDAQKYFSHFRGCIASSIYTWRGNTSQNPAEKLRMFKEADFAYRQAFAFAPFSPEVVFHYVNFLATVGRLDDAVLVAATCLKLDPNNAQVDGLVKYLNSAKGQRAGSILGPDAAQVQTKLQQLEKTARDNPDNVNAAFNLAGAYWQMQQKDKALAVLDQVLANPKVNATTVMSLVQAYSQMSDLPRLEGALQKLARLTPDSPETWDDLAALEIALGKTPDAMKALQNCVDANARRLARNPTAKDLLPLIRADARFNALHQSPEFQKLTAPK